MKCNCGYTAFYYQKFSDNKRWNVYKCGHVIIESKKKTKCDMNICEYVSDIKEVNFTETEEKIVYTTETPNPEKVYRQELKNYIHLCENEKTGLKKRRGNYIANINFLLRRLNFELYFEETETLESLKLRIQNKYVPIKHKINKFPINLVDYPEELKVFKKEPIKKKKVEIKKIPKKKKNFLLSSAERVEVENKKEETLPSDAETDSEAADEENTFDVDNYDSGEDYQDIDDGAFSD